MKKSIIAGIFIVILLVAGVIFYYVLIIPKSVKLKNDIEKIAYEYYKQRNGVSVNLQFADPEFYSIRESKENVEILNIKGDNFNIEYSIFENLACPITDKPIKEFVESEQFGVVLPGCIDLRLTDNCVKNDVKCNFIEYISFNKRPFGSKYTGIEYVKEYFPEIGFDNETIIEKLKKAEFILEKDAVDKIQFNFNLKNCSYDADIFIKNKKPFTMSENRICTL